VRVAWIAGLVGVALIGLPSAAAAQVELPVGEAEGVRIVRERGAIVVVFTSHAKKLWRRVAGRPVSVLCTEFLDDGTAGGGATMRAPKRGRKIRTGDLTRGMDYCRVWLAKRTYRRDGGSVTRGRELVVSVPLTQRGAVYLDEEKNVRLMMSVLLFAGLDAEDRGQTTRPTAEQLLSRRPRIGRLVFALSGPADTPPAGKVGYWSDGMQHLAVVTVSALGRRLFWEGEGDVLHTNVAGYVYNEID
jgi:hypothetical protein